MQGYNKQIGESSALLFLKTWLWKAIGNRMALHGGGGCWRVAGANSPTASVAEVQVCRVGLRCLCPLASLQWQRRNASHSVLLMTVKWWVLTTAEGGNVTQGQGFRVTEHCAAFPGILPLSLFLFLVASFVPCASSNGISTGPQLHDICQGQTRSIHHVPGLDTSRVRRAIIRRAVVWRRLRSSPAVSSRSAQGGRLVSRCGGVSTQGAVTNADL